jgi:hypothetical protein
MRTVRIVKMINGREDVVFEAAIPDDAELAFDKDADRLVIPEGTGTVAQVEAEFATTPRRIGMTTELGAHTIADPATKRSSEGHGMSAKEQADATADAQAHSATAGVAQGRSDVEAMKAAVQADAEAKSPSSDSGEDERTVEQLQDELRKQGKPVSGNKQELIERLNEPAA